MKNILIILIFLFSCTPYNSGFRGYRTTRDVSLRHPGIVRVNYREIDTTYIKQYRQEFRENIEDSIVFLIDAYLARDIHFGLEESILIKEIRKLKYSEPTLKGYKIWLNKKRKLK